MFAVEIKAEFKGQNLLHPAKLFNGNAVSHAEKLALDEATKEALRLANLTTATWDTRPRFTAHKIYTANGGRVEIWVSDKRWLWLDQGTKVRYAQMTNGFVAKTRVGVVYSYGGSGRLARVLKKTPKNRLPGIKERGWSGIITERVNPIIRRTYMDELHTRWTNPE